MHKHLVLGSYGSPLMDLKLTFQYLQVADQYQSRPVRNQATEQVRVNVMCLNHPETILPHLPLSVEKLSFHKTGPWCQKGWGPLR